MGRHVADSARGGADLLTGTVTGVRYLCAVSEPHADRPQMPDYGVDTSDWSALPWSWAGDRLVATRNYWVVTASADARPHAMPVWGVWDDADHRFAFSCGPRSRKARNLAANPQMVVMADDTVECVSVEGRASLLTDKGRVAVWVERYLAKYQPISPGLSAEFIASNALFEFTAERAFAIIEREEEFSTRATRWSFSD
jgi:hypothetical protein